jgi:hypothetical protein
MGAKSMSSYIWRFGVLAVGLPLAASVVSLVVLMLLPSCHYLFSADCSSCAWGMGKLIGTVMVTGPFVALGALLLVLPACIVLTIAVRHFERRKKGSGEGLPSVKP